MSNKDIAKLIGEDVEIAVEDFNRYITQKGVVVRVSVGGGRNSYYVSPKIYGVRESELTDEGKEFFGEHVRDGSIVFVPKIYEKKLRAIEAKLKKKQRELSIGYDNTFIPLNSYAEFKEYFDKCKEEYFELRDELVERYSFMYKRFIAIAKQSLQDLNAYHAEGELKNVISKLPSKVKFEESFRMDMTVSAFPTFENLDFFDKNIQDDIKSVSTKDTNDLVRDATACVINEAIASLSSIIRGGAENGRIHQRILYGLKNSINRMGVKNIFFNPKLENIRTEMSELLTTDTDTTIELSERLLAELYNYSMDLGIQDYIDLKNCPFNKEKLIAIYELYN